MVRASYKEVFALELGDEGVFEGERYKISWIDNKLDRVILTLYNKKKVVYNVDAEMFAVSIGITIDKLEPGESIILQSKQLR